MGGRRVAGIWEEFVGNERGAVRRWMAMASVAPGIVCAVLGFAFAYDAPYWDEWVLVEPIVKAFDGTLTASDFLMQVNEHVCVLPNLIVVPLARLTQWDLRAEIGITLAFYAATFGLIIAGIRRVEGSGAGMGSLWVMPAMACAVFSISQHALWNWGFLLTVAMAAFFLVWALLLLSGERADWMRVAGATTAGWAATFSVGGGLSVWPAGAMVLVVRRFDTPQQRWAALAAWLIAGGIAAGVYARLSAAAAGGMGEQLVNVIGIAAYALAFLGGPAAAFSGVVAALAGAALVLAYGAMVWRTRARGGLTGVWPLVIGLGAAAGTASVLTAMKHVHEGVENAISSRFLPWGTLAWCGLAMAVYATWPTVREMPRAVRAAVAASLVGVLASSAYGAYKAEERHDAFLLGRRALIENPMSPDMIFLHPEPETLGKQRELLVKYRLTVFSGSNDERN
jgi:hypothetical protein